MTGMVHITDNFIGLLVYLDAYDFLISKYMIFF